jgi:hypothetical protein
VVEALIVVDDADGPKADADHAQLDRTSVADRRNNDFILLSVFENRSRKLWRERFFSKMNRANALMESCSECGTNLVDGDDDHVTWLSQCVLLTVIICDTGRCWVDSVSLVDL